MTTAIADLAVEVSDLRQSFGSGSDIVTAVDGVSFGVKRGEVVALLGPNGAGKTTVIDMVLGFTNPRSGQVRVLSGAPRQAIAQGRISAVLQTGGLLSDLTVLETVRAIAGLQRASTERMTEVMQRTQLAAIAKRRVSKCSGGEQQRIRYALSLLTDPDILILDEPTAAMDVNARAAFWNSIEQDVAAGRTIIFATHYLEEAQEYAPRTILMSEGRIVVDAPTAQIRASLGGRSLRATLPPDSVTLVAEIDASDATIDLRVSGGVIEFRSSDSDRAAAILLAGGATDLEITAPSLNTAFSALTGARA